MVRGKGVWERARAYAGGLFPRVGPARNSSRAYVHAFAIFSLPPRAQNQARRSLFMLIKYKFKYKLLTFWPVCTMGFHSIKLYLKLAGGKHRQCSTTEIIRFY